MNTSQIKQDAPSACIVCLNCLNNGRALGIWITAEQAAAEIDAELITYGGQAEPATYPNTENAFTRCRKCGGDEWELADYEHTPRTCGTVLSFYENAEQLNDLYDNDDLDLINDLAACIDTGGQMTLDELIRYHENNYVGKHDNEREFAQEYAENVGDENAVPEHMRPYIDWEHYARELMYDYWQSGGHYWRSV